MTDIQNGVRLQANFKPGQTPMYNVYAATPEEFQLLVAGLADQAGELAATQQGIDAAHNLAAGGVTGPVQQQSTPAPAQQAQPAGQAPQQAGIPACAHGPRVYRSGVKNGTAWAAWFCSVPKGAPGNCGTQWA